ncbi:MAG: hypothetical protein IH624_00705, partial [Phycisphaerae bacterium]|nr:hypothetical protein [Phycisphaerae bacterium]
YWWVDDYKTCRRSWYCSEGQKYSVDELCIDEILEDVFALILSLEIDNLKLIDNVYKEWKNISDSRKREDIEQYPIPNIPTA